MAACTAVAFVEVSASPVGAGVTTTARAVAQYCIPAVDEEAAGNVASKGCIVRSRLVTVTFGYVGVIDTDEEFDEEVV